MASKSILEDLSSAGIERLPPLQFIQLTAADSIGEIWKSELLFALSQASTKRTAEILLCQLSIGPVAMDSIAAEIEGNHFESALQQIQKIQQWAEFGIQLTQPRIVVFCGQPNVGKSSLVNSIVGFQRAIVNEVAGTTRDVVSQSTAIAGWPVELRDTAGLRESENIIEAIGIQKARTEIAAADLKICVFDASRSWDESDGGLIDSINPDLVVLNKSDLANQSDVQDWFGRIPDAIVTSAESGKGVDVLIQQIGTRLTPNLPDPQQAIPISADQAARLEESATILSASPTNGSQSERNAAAAEALERLLKRKHRGTEITE